MAICWLNTGTYLVIMGNLLVGGSVDKRSSVVDEGCVRAGDSLVLDVSVVLLVLVNKVVHDLSPAVGQLHSVLTCNTLTG